MGLLTSTSQHKNIAHKYLKVYKVLSLIGYIIGVGWFLGLSYKPFNNKTYFSENALLPGVVDDQFYHGADASNYASDFKKETEKNENELPVRWLAERFRELGLDVYEHNFTYHYPISLFGGKEISARNTHAILRAPKAASTEALVLSTPFRIDEGSSKSNHAAIGLLLAVAKYFRKNTYWAKDIIFLITDHEQVGMQAWLDSYHSVENPYFKHSFDCPGSCKYDTDIAQLFECNTMQLLPERRSPEENNCSYCTNKDISSGEMFGRAGSIQAAINIEIPSEKISGFNLNIQGLNGQLPNLDLINLANILCKKENIRTSLHDQLDYPYPETDRGMKQSLKTYFLMMWDQSSGTPTGNHGMFLRYHIESLTLSGTPLKSNRDSHGFTSMGRVIEGIFRSLNNLLERFHQSFFFYILPATTRYVSIGLFMPPFAVICAGVLLEFQAVALWLSCLSEEESLNEGGDGDKNDKAAAASEDSKPSSARLVSLTPMLLMSVMFGAVSYKLPGFFIRSTTQMAIEPGEGMALGMLALFFSAIFFPYMLKRKTSSVLRPGIWKLLKCVALLALGMVLYALAVMNISLAFFLAVLLVPITTSIRPVNNRILTFIQAVILFSISPPMISIYSSFIQLIFIDNVKKDLLGNMWNMFETGLIWAAVQNHLFGNWLFALVTLVLFPIWLMFWSVIWSTV